ncbi:MAG: PEP-CTERM sorting domain-containing protein [Acidobacteriota bacterium]|nr:PEP-CTERM sorting domain-containing protein [Acidobacteriota bacterium]
MVNKLKVAVIAALAMTVMATSAMAATIIDFRNGAAAAGGAITFDGTNAIGNDLPIGLVEVFGAPTNNGVFAVTGMLTNSSGMVGDLDFNTTSGSDFITIMGCIPGLGVGTFLADGTCTAPVALLSGSIDSFNASNQGTPGNEKGAIWMVGPDTKHADLLSAIGLAPNTPFELFGFALLTGPLGQTPQKSISTDIRNSEMAPIPEPATMMLLGTGLLAAFRARRKQQQQLL